MTDVTKKYEREENSKALINKDVKALEEYKFKKNLLKDINNMKKTIETLEERLNALEIENASMKKELNKNN